MKVTESFRRFVIDQLASVRNVKARAMFGGLGLYAGDVFFGILASDVLYLKVDDTNRPDFERLGGRPFTPFADQRMTMSYYDVPAAILEDAATLAVWARTAIAVASRNRPPTRG